MWSEDVIRKEEIQIVTSSELSLNNSNSHSSGNSDKQSLQVPCHLLENHCSAACVQDLSEQIPQTGISLLVLYLDRESWDLRIQKRIYHPATMAAIPQQQLAIYQQQLPHSLLVHLQLLLLS